MRVESGTRLYPVTSVVSKQLLPVFDKPMIYYPLSTLMLAGIRDILIITTPQDQALFQRLLGDGSDFGSAIRICRAGSSARTGRRIHHRRRLHRDDRVALILGDNIFYGHGMAEMLARAPCAFDGRDSVRIYGQDPGTIWRHRAGRSRARDIDRGKAAATRSRTSR